MTKPEAQSEQAARYTHLRELGRGAMGVVDLVYDEVRSTPVARKRMHLLTSEARFHIKQEFRQAQEIRHPNLVRLYDLFADDADAFFTMEPVFGVDVATEVQLATERLGQGSPEAVAIIVDRLRQLAEAVAALHAAGVVHRDIKPSNVLVEDTDRLVLLDFGFSSTLSSVINESEDHALIGTIPYMAPECLWGAQASTCSDWYSVGVIAAELCLGRALFAGSLQAVVRDKDRPPTSLLAALPNLPASLDGLLCALLRRDPGDRPSDAAEIRAALGSPASATRAVPMSGIASLFVGRSTELAELERGIPFEPRAQVVRIHGPSGIGKTALIRELCARLDRRPDWTIFRGRCHPREHLALKALDSVMDEVSRHLKRAGTRSCARIAKLDGIGALLHMFPVLRRVPELADIDASADRVDPQTRWIEGLRAFRALWETLARLDRIAVWIDDLQWADKDGQRLLHELISVEPRPAITWILSHRSAGQTHEASAAALSKEAPDGSFELALSGMARSDATEFAIRLGASRQIAGAVERESGGSPFIITELTRSALSGGELASVESVLEDRLRALDASELSIVEQLALADGPLPVSMLAAPLAANASVARVLERLENEGLVRVSYGGDSEELAEAYHDRIREAVAGRMSEAARRTVHIRLADALAQRLSSTTRAAVAYHYRRAGALERGLALTLEAAEECTDALAFEQAAQLYEEALAIHPKPTPVDLIERAADALARAGRCDDAAGRYLEASAQAADRSRKRALQLQAGAHFLYAGRIREGREVMEAVLREHGLRWPNRPLLLALWERGRFLLARNDASRSVAPIDPLHAERFDALWAVTKGTIMVQHMAGDAIALLALREALRLGDPSRTIWALGHEAASEANIGGARMHRRARAMLTEIGQLAQLTGQRFDHAWVRMVEGVVSHFQGGWARAESALCDARRLYRDRYTGPLHEQNVAACFLIATLEQQGKVRTLAALLSELRASAQYTGNLYTSFLFRCASSGLVALAEDRPDAAIAEADAALAAWPMSDFTSQHWNHFTVTLGARLYAGHTREAWDQVERTWPLLQRAQFLRLEGIGLQLRQLRASAALSACAGADTREARRLHAIAASDAAAIRKSSLPHARPLAAAIEYGLATRVGQWQLAAEHCEVALSGFDQAGMQLAREIARLRMASLTPRREPARKLEQEARAWLAAAGVRNPEAMARSLMPDATPTLAR